MSDIERWEVVILVMLLVFGMPVFMAMGFKAGQTKAREYLDRPPVSYEIVLQDFKLG